MVGCAFAPRIPIPVIKKSPPLEIDQFQKLQAIAFEKAVIAIPRGTVIGSYGKSINYGADHVNIDENSASTLCNRYSSKMNWGAGVAKVHGRDSEYNKSFYDALTAAGYKTLGDPNKLFDRNKERTETDFKIGARITDIKANFCSLLSWMDYRDLGIEAGEVYIEVEWSIYSPLERKTIGKLKTEGYSKLEDAVSGAFLIVYHNAFQAAAEELANNQEFFKLVSQPEQANDVQPSSEADIFVRNEKRSASDDINDHMADILNGTVTLRNADGHGSGFFIDSSGLLLTNAHVVGEAKEVRVLFPSGIELEGNVLRKNEHRDVALVKVTLKGIKPLSIDQTPPNPADEVYAVGTPLDEGLKASVTKGIVSSIRKLKRNNLELIQSDVNVQPGNSGGPLLDNHGNVIGISVLGIQVNGAAIGTNFFIPIMDGLKWLNVKIRDEK